MIKRLKVKINWWKHNRNSLFHKIICFIYPPISPTLMCELEFAKIKGEKMRMSKWD